MNFSKKNQEHIKVNRYFMSKILFSLALIALITVSAFSQEPPRKQHRSVLTPDQTAELQTKKMTLQLELTEKQQQQILAINKRNAIERNENMEEHRSLREKGQKPSNDELVKIKSTRLDKQIAHQKEMKKILNDKQFETWKNSRKNKTHKMKNRKGNRKAQNRSKMPRKG